MERDEVGLKAENISLMRRWRLNHQAQLRLWAIGKSSAEIGESDYVMSCHPPDAGTPRG